MNEQSTGREDLLREIRALEDELSHLKHSLNSAKITQQFEREPAKTEGLTRVFNLLKFDSIGVSHVNIRGDMFEANDEFCRIIGYSREEIESGVVQWDQITPKEFEHLDARAVEEVLKHGKANPFEKEYINKSGHRVPVLLAVTASDTTGNDCLSFALDLTMQKRAEAALKESEARYRQLCSLLPQIIWVLDKDGNVIFLNDQFFEFTGLPRESASSEEWKQSIHPDDLERIWHKPWKKSSLFPQAIEGEVRYKRADGVYRWHIARALPITNTKKELLFWFGTSTDIDDQKNETQILKESEMQAKTLADAIPQIVWTAEPDGSIDFFNQRWFEYTGLSLEQSLDGGWSLLIHPEDRQNYLDGWNKSLQDGTTHEIAFRLRRAAGLTANRDDVYRWHLARAVPLRDDNNSIRQWFATWTEIENQKTRRGRS